MSKPSARTWRLLAAAYAAALAAVSLLPSGQGPLGGWDAEISPTLQNTLHVPAYAILALITILGLRSARPAAALLAALACCLFGLALELAQAFIPGRTGSLEDTLLNTAGVAVALAAAWTWKTFARRPPADAARGPSAG